MNASVNILCYKSKTLSNGEHPLMIRVCKDNKKKYKSLGISINPHFWDFVKNKPKKNYPNRESLESLISDKIKAFSQSTFELNSIEKEYTAVSLIEKVCKPKASKTVNDFYLEQIKRLEAAKRTGYALSCKNVYNSLLAFNGHLNIYFSDIDITWLRKYEAWLKSKNLAENTIGIRFRTLRAIYNLAIEENIVKAEYYPFNSYKVSKHHVETAKRALSKDEILQVINYESKNPHIALSIDIFAFSYFMGGMNFVDIAYLTKNNLIDGRLVYNRKKTNKLIKLPIQQKALDIIEKYRDSKNTFLFPILTGKHTSEQQITNRIHKVITKTNTRLKKVGLELNIPIKLTTYVARHSFATVLKRSGVPTSIICESLGHSSERVTQIYLDRFENKQIEDAFVNLL